MKNGNTPAMPQDRGIWVEGIGDFPTLATGLTKREHFAAMAMQGILPMTHNGTDEISQEIAKIAVSCADALLAELEKQNEAQ